MPIPFTTAVGLPTPIPCDRCGLWLVSGVRVTTESRLIRTQLIRTQLISTSSAAGKHYAYVGDKKGFDSSGICLSHLRQDGKTVTRKTVKMMTSAIFVRKSKYLSQGMTRSYKGTTWQLHYNRRSLTHYITEASAFIRWSWVLSISKVIQALLRAYNAEASWQVPYTLTSTYKPQWVLYKLTKADKGPILNLVWYLTEFSC